MMRMSLIALPLLFAAGCATTSDPDYVEGQAQAPAGIDLEALRRVPDNAPPVVEGEPGPYSVTLRESPDLPDFTIYEPVWMEGGRERFAVIAWGNGGCANRNTGTREFLVTLASHGFVVVAPGALDAPEDSGRTEAIVQKQAMDWAERENARSDSPLSGRIETDNMSVAGWSCGGMQSIANAGDPRVRTVALFNSGLFVDPMPMLGNVTKDDLSNLHTPTGYFSGGPVDPAHANAVDDFERINHVPIFLGAVDTGHLGTYRHPGGGRVATVAAHWFEYTLYGDEAAAAQFVGENCGLCADPYWTVQRKNM